MLGPLGEAACKEGIVPSVVGWLRWNHPGLRGVGAVCHMQVSFFSNPVVWENHVPH